MGVINTLKKFLFVLICALVLIFVGCSSNNLPINVRYQIYQLGLEAIIITDQYLDMEIEVAEVDDKLNNLTKKFDEFDTISFSELEIKGLISSIRIVFNPVLYSDRIREKINDEEVLERRNILAKKLNQPLRDE